MEETRWDMILSALFNCESNLFMTNDLTIYDMIYYIEIIEKHKGTIISHTFPTLNKNEMKIIAKDWESFQKWLDEIDLTHVTYDSWLYNKMAFDLGLSPSSNPRSGFEEDDGLYKMFYNYHNRLNRMRFLYSLL